MSILIIYLLTFFFIFIDGKSIDETSSKHLRLIGEEYLGDLFAPSSKYSQLVGRKLIPKKFEASDAVLNDDGSMMIVVFDNTYHLGAFCTSKESRSLGCFDQMIRWFNSSVEKSKSEFEGIARNYLDGSYYLLQETIQTSTNPSRYQPNIVQIRLESKNFVEMKFIESCLVNFHFDSTSKGFEGLEFVVHHRTGKSYLLALCEANQCSSVKDKYDFQRGFGRIILLEKQMKKTSCLWQPVALLPLPSTIDFLDYSAISILRSSSSHSVAITSQEDSRVWIGQLVQLSTFPFFQFSTGEKSSSTDIFHFPFENQSGDKQYCHVEGVSWFNSTQLLFVSDAAKSDDLSKCFKKEQRIHYFSIE